MKIAFYKSTGKGKINLLKQRLGGFKLQRCSE
jgi:hypothetical protein